MSISGQVNWLIEMRVYRSVFIWKPRVCLLNWKSFGDMFGTFGDALAAKVGGLRNEVGPLGFVIDFVYRTDEEGHGEIFDMIKCLDLTPCQGRAISCANR